MAKKSNADLALAEKKDVLRTFQRLKHRLLIARELNELEEILERNHEKEVASGKLTTIDVDSLGLGNLVKELPSGDSSSGPSSNEAGNDTA